MSARVSLWDNGLLEYWLAKRPSFVVGYWLAMWPSFVVGYWLAKRLSFVVSYMGRKQLPGRRLRAEADHKASGADITGRSL